MSHSIPVSSVLLADEQATVSFGHAFAKYTIGGVVIYLQGELGAGKTTFTRGVLQGLGYAERVKSPTYTLVETYIFPGLYFYHFDLYRFSDPIEWDEAGFREYFHPHSACLIEWPQKGQGFLPAADWIITLSVAGDSRVAQVAEGRKK